MFDYVDHSPIPCWNCGHPVSGWQSKDGECLLQKIPYTKVHKFYCGCDGCGAWNEYNVFYPLSNADGPSTVIVKLDIYASYNIDGKSAKELGLTKSITYAEPITESYAEAEPLIGPYSALLPYSVLTKDDILSIPSSKVPSLKTKKPLKSEYKSMLELYNLAPEEEEVDDGSKDGSS